MQSSKFSTFLRETYLAIDYKNILFQSIIGRQLVQARSSLNSISFECILIYMSNDQLMIIQCIRLPFLLSGCRINFYSVDLLTYLSMDERSSDRDTCVRK